MITRIPVPQHEHQQAGDHTVEPIKRTSMAAVLGQRCEQRGFDRSHSHLMRNPQEVLPRVRLAASPGACAPC